MGATRTLFWKNCGSDAVGGPCGWLFNAFHDFFLVLVLVWTSAQIAGLAEEALVIETLIRVFHSPPMPYSLG